MGAALGYGALAASSLVIGALIGVVWKRLDDRRLAPILGFGAGALISAVSFELFGEGIDLGGLGWTAVGLAIGALTFYLANNRVSPVEDATSPSQRAKADDDGNSLALGAFLDGIPEQLVLGIGLAAGQGVGISLLVAIFVSNLPEGVGSAARMRRSRGRRGTLVVWVGVAVICTLATGIGYLVADASGPGLLSAINGFAAGALLVMLSDSMIPEAQGEENRKVGLLVALGFAVAAALSAAN
ncbi:ZIP family metal transporter [Thermoleophilia bacterium SCSIO 60948]|nr:ZIP family metal transporter [Thermoleophilia bacterium SCSIO 60948]